MSSFCKMCGAMLRGPRIVVGDFCSFRCRFKDWRARVKCFVLGHKRVVSEGNLGKGCKMAEKSTSKMVELLDACELALLACSPVGAGGCAFPTARSSAIAASKSSDGKNHKRGGV